LAGASAIANLIVQLESPPLKGLSVVAKPYIIKVRSVDDIVNLVLAAQILLIHRVSADSKSILYVQLPVYNSLAIYYCMVDENVKGKYVLYNRFTGEVQISEKFVNNSKLIVIPIVDIMEQEMLPKELIESFSKKKSKRDEKLRVVL